MSIYNWLEAAMPQTVDDQGIGAVIFHLCIASRHTEGITQPPIGRVVGGVKHPEPEADHSSLSSTEVMNAWSYSPTLSYVFITWCLIVHSDIFVFTL
jgi:hypothetical protein